MLCLWAGGGHQTRKRKKYILVMENLFHNRKVPRGLRFDLKGALSFLLPCVCVCAGLTTCHRLFFADVCFFACVCASRQGTPHSSR